MMRKITIQSSKGPYDAKWFSSFAETVEVTKGENRLYLVDRKVRSLYPLELALAGERVIEVDALEETKSYLGMMPILTAIVEMGFKKNHQLIVVGGGILQDIGAFAATVLMRGVSWTLIPTTLLSQADSCVGSKSSLNLGNYKNQLGTFCPPKEILLSTSVLRTLDSKDISSGVGEVLKIALVKGRPEFERAKSLLNRFTADDHALEEMVFESLKIKQGYVEEDEFDQGKRNLLNYGHTFGHAFESISGFKIPHGLAVAIGIDAATYFSHRLGFVDEAHVGEIASAVRPLVADYLGLVREMPADEILGVMAKDKKNQTLGVTCILTEGPGLMFRRSIAEKDWMLRTLADFQGTL